MIAAEQVSQFETVLNRGGIVLFPSDTVYGLAWNPASVGGRARVHEIKGRDAQKPAALMFFDLDWALSELGALPDVVVEACSRLLPGPYTLLLPATAAPAIPGLPIGQVLGLRVPRLEGGLAPLAAMRVPFLQTSANRSGAPPANRLEDVDSGIVGAVDLAIDAGELAGIASTVIDLTGFAVGRWEIVRAGTPASDRRADELLASFGPGWG